MLVGVHFGEDVIIRVHVDFFILMLCYFYIDAKIKNTYLVNRVCVYVFLIMRRVR